MVNLSRRRGFTLVEVLVALLVLGVGVLGFAGLQLQALKVTGQAYSRDQASNLAVDLAERIRINQDQAVLNVYLNANTWQAPDCAVPPAAYCAEEDGDAATNCTTAQMAAFDAFDIMCSATTLMPNAKVFIDATCSDGDNPCIRVAWDNHEAWDDVENSLSACRGQSNCVELEIVP